MGVRVRSTVMNQKMIGRQGNRAEDVIERTPPPRFRGGGLSIPKRDSLDRPRSSVPVQ